MYSRRARYKSYVLSLLPLGIIMVLRNGTNHPYWSI
jgi:hypothetical protein